MKSLSDLHSLRELSTKCSSEKELIDEPTKLKPVDTFITYKHLNEYERSKWSAVLDLLEDPFFLKLTSGLEKKISSKKYSFVTAVLTYPTKADAIIKQEDLNRAHGIAYLIKTGVNSGSIKYTNARVPSTWRIAGNPGTRR
jgi:hypothetical protein